MNREDAYTRTEADAAAFEYDRAGRPTRFQSRVSDDEYSEVEERG